MTTCSHLGASLHEHLADLELALIQVKAELARMRPSDSNWRHLDLAEKRRQLSRRIATARGRIAEQHTNQCAAYGLPHLHAV